VIRQSVDSIRDTASSFSRAFVIEVMGRHCGYLALTTALACGAEICLVPEMPYNLDTIGARLKHDIENGRRYVLAVVAEGTKMGDYLTRWINDSIGMEARLTVLGHVQRGGSPSVHDRIMAYKFAVAAVEPSKPAKPTPSWSTAPVPTDSCPSSPSPIPNTSSIPPCSASQPP
jgi:6-phosphofructokinase 1